MTQQKTIHQQIKEMPSGVFVTLAKVQPVGSLQARKHSAGAVSFFWRYSVNDKSERVPIGFYDSAAPPKSLEPTANGYSFAAAIRAAQDLAQEHHKHREEGGRPALVARKRKQEAEQAKKQAAEHAVTVDGVWALYLQDRRPYWGDRHYQDHLKLSQPGGEVAIRGTRGRGRTIAGPLHPLMGMRLQELTPLVIEEWAGREAKTRPTSARLSWRLLRAFLSWCLEHPQYSALVPAQNPAKTRRTRQALGKPGVKQDALLREQLPAWFSAVRSIANPVIAAYLQTLLLTGAREGEVLAMRWADIDERWRIMTIRDKVEGERVIPLTPYVWHLLEPLPRINEWVFSSPMAANGQLAVPRSAHILACKEAEVKGLTLHGLRRSFGTLSEWLELPAGVVAQIQGHKPSATAEKHYRVRPLDLLRLHHERLEAWMLRQGRVPFLAERLKDMERQAIASRSTLAAAAYLDAAMEMGDPVALLSALRQVAKGTELEDVPDLNEKSELTLTTVNKILLSAGLRLNVTPLELEA